MFELTQIVNQINFSVKNIWLKSLLQVAENQYRRHSLPSNGIMGPKRVFSHG